MAFFPPRKIFGHFLPSNPTPHLRYIHQVFYFLYADVLTSGPCSSSRGCLSQVSDFLEIANNLPSVCTSLIRLSAPDHYPPVLTMITPQGQVPDNQGQPVWASPPYPTSRLKLFKPVNPKSAHLASPAPWQDITIKAPAYGSPSPSAS